jgi:hypothetical protein
LLESFKYTFLPSYSPPDTPAIATDSLEDGSKESEQSTGILFYFTGNIFKGTGKHAGFLPTRGLFWPKINTDNQTVGVNKRTFTVTIS